VGGGVGGVSSSDSHRWLDARRGASTAWIRLRSGHDQRTGWARRFGSLGDDGGTCRPRGVPYRHRMWTQAGAGCRASSPWRRRCRHAVCRRDTTSRGWKLPPPRDRSRDFVPRSWRLADLCFSPPDVECRVARRRIGRFKRRSPCPRGLVRPRTAPSSEWSRGARRSRSPGALAARRRGHRPAGGKALPGEG
jgi:hypothetical protein